MLPIDFGNKCHIALQVRVPGTAVLQDFLVEYQKPKTADVSCLYTKHEVLSIVAVVESTIPLVQKRHFERLQVLVVSPALRTSYDTAVRELPCKTLPDDDAGIP